VLTAREYEIARAVAEGLSNKQIARALGISEGTVKIHLAVLMQNAQGPRRTYSG
jgi:DNA-binding NarL/FixJ family response regulator